MTIEGMWEKNTAPYASGELYRVGKIVLASVYWESGSRDDVDRKPWAIRLDLPGIKQPPERYATIEEAKARTERAVAKWFSWVQP